MATMNQVTMNKTIFYDMNTTNTSFLQTHSILKDLGIQNNSFFLILLDPDLRGVDPRDPRLNSLFKKKVLFETMRNYWYYLREVCVIPVQGGSANSGDRFQLHRANLAMNWCIMHNLNIFAEMPRQQGKTITIICRILYEFLFVSTNSEMIFINKKHEDSKLNLQRLKEIRSALPVYLQMIDQWGEGGKKIKVKNSVETLENPINNNKIKTLPAARNRVAANSLGRGMTIPRIWYDEFAFIPYNSIIYAASTPAFNTASLNAARNGAPYGIIITTTPGDLTTEEGIDACGKKDLATKCSERWYDFSPGQLKELLDMNKKSAFVYIRYTYQQLGKDEAWFADICRKMELKWADIRREVLLEWSKSSDNSPFTKEDLSAVKALIKQPIRTLPFRNGLFEFNVYEDINLNNPPIMGVDVSGGFRRDASAITLIDSSTTKVFADFACNFIAPNELAALIYEVVKTKLPNAVVNIERNGGFGSSVLGILLKTSIKRNLFYEVKDKVTEERSDGVKNIRKTVRTKVYGLDSSKGVREELMEILRQRMEYHKDKFVSPAIYNELETLEVKKNGKIEHSSTAHDDQIFSYLMALYVWYNGQNLMENWGIRKSSIKTDTDLEEAILTLEDKYSGVLEEINIDNDDDPNKIDIEVELKQLQSIKAKSMEQFYQDQYNADIEAEKILMSNRRTRAAMARVYSMDEDDMKSQEQGIVDITSAINDFYK